MSRLALLAAVGTAALLLSACTYDYLQRTDRVGYSAGDAVRANLEAQTIVSPSGKQHSFGIDPRRREGLLQGLDEVALTLKRDNEILAFQAADRTARPWIHFARKSA